MDYLKYDFKKRYCGFSLKILILYKGMGNFMFVKYFLCLFICFGGESRRFIFAFLFFLSFVGGDCFCSFLFYVVVCDFLQDFVFGLVVFQVLCLGFYFVFKIILDVIVSWNFFDFVLKGYLDFLQLYFRVFRFCFFRRNSYFLGWVTVFVGWIYMCYFS